MLPRRSVALCPVNDPGREVVLRLSRQTGLLDHIHEKHHQQPYPVCTECGALERVLARMRTYEDASHSPAEAHTSHSPPRNSCHTWTCHAPAEGAPDALRALCEELETASLAINMTKSNAWSAGGEARGHGAEQPADLVDQEKLEHAPKEIIAPNDVPPSDKRSNHRTSCGTGPLPNKHHEKPHDTGRRLHPEQPTSAQPEPSATLWTQRSSQLPSRKSHGPSSMRMQHLTSTLLDAAEDLQHTHAIDTWTSTHANTPRLEHKKKAARTRSARHTTDITHCHG